MSEARRSAEAAGLVAGPDDDVPLPDPERLVGQLALVLARLHDVDVPAGAGPTLAPSALVDAARRAVDGGWRPDPAGPYAHMAPDRLVEVLDAGADAVGALRCVTHGAPTVGRVRLRAGAPTLTDWERAAVADPYRDLAAAANDIARSIGPMLVHVLFERYQEARPSAGPPDPRRLDWYVLAGQFPP